jgi:exodeoxyribonuclease VII large subunit
MAPPRGTPRIASLFSYGEGGEGSGTPLGNGKRGGGEASAGPRIYGVGELTDCITEILENDQRLGDVWVKGELSNYSRSSAGHAYFVLKDERAVLNCVMFREAFGRLKFQLADGLKLLVHGQISVYPPRGAYNLKVVEARPEGLGALFLAYEQLKKKLEAEGLFDPRFKRRLPVLPAVVGVVTSPTGAVLQDIRNILFGRFPNARLLLAPARVQGEGAARELIAALGLLNSLEEDAPEVIILARGGGSLEDLWAFNDEALARAIRASRIPVVSAVGHETDFTIADFAADVRAPTPSKAAEMVMPRRADMEERLRMLATGLRRELAGRFDQARLRTDELSRSLGRSVVQLLDRRREKLQRYGGLLDAMSPMQVLGRGYSITIRQSTGSAVRDPAELREGEDVRTLVSRGDFVSTVKAVGTIKEGILYPKKARPRRAPGRN